MDDPKIILTRDWLYRAILDLKSAKVLAEGQPPLYATALFHCQQAAEKSIKAFLNYSDIIFEKTHNLVRLIDQAAGENSEFKSFNKKMEQLTPYVQILRYPFGMPPPTAEEFQEAYTAAEDVYLFVLNLLPNKSHPE